MIRRYVTDRVRLVDSLFHSYFTHVAIFTGDDELIEAGGTEHDSRDDITRVKLLTSDWLDDRSETVVVFRPTQDKTKITREIEFARRIADDDRYMFGVHAYADEKYSCAELAYDSLITGGFPLPTQSDAVLTTPDYLFEQLSNNLNLYTLVIWQTK